MPRVLVTGGAGYVGSVLVPKLAREYEVTVLDACIFGQPTWRDEHIRMVCGDIRDRTAVAEALQGAQAVIHLAALGNDPASDLDEAATRAINYDATGTLVDASHAAGVQRFIYASSSSVYGVKEEEHVTEELSLEPITLYARLKAEAEEFMVRAASADFTTTSVRAATVCGVSPRQRFDVIVNIMARLAETTGRITVFGGNQYRPNVHIDDLTDAYVALLEAPAGAINGRAFNIGATNHTVLEIAEMTQRICGGEAVVDHNVQDERSYRIDSSLIREAIGFEVTRGIDDAIRDPHNAFAAGRFGDHDDERYYDVRATKRWLDAGAPIPGDPHTYSAK